MHLKYNDETQSNGQQMIVILCELSFIISEASISEEKHNTYSQSASLSLLTLHISALLLFNGVIAMCFIEGDIFVCTFNFIKHYYICEPGAQKQS